MTVGELIKKLESMPQNVPVYAEGEEADKVIMENCQGNVYVRIFKAWDVNFVVGESAEMLVDGEWIHGKIVEGYRFNDGIVTIEDENGSRYWCGQDRTDLYRKG